MAFLQPQQSLYPMPGQLRSKVRPRPDRPAHTHVQPSRTSSRTTTIRHSLRLAAEVGKVCGRNRRLRLGTHNLLDSPRVVLTAIPSFLTMARKDKSPITSRQHHRTENVCILKCFFPPMAWAQNKMKNADTGRIHLTLCSHRDKTAFNLLYRQSVFYLLIKRREICVNKMLNWVLYMFIVGLSLLCRGSFSTFPGNRWLVPLQCVCVLARKPAHRPLRFNVKACGLDSACSTWFISSGTPGDISPPPNISATGQQSLLILLEANYLTN